jgi:uncharacterized protein
MLLDLSEIVMRSGMRSAVDVDQETLDDPDLRLAEPLVGRVEFRNGGDLLNISGRLKTVLEIPCARCLADVRVPISLGLDEHFPLEDVTHPTAPPEEGEEFDTLVSSIVHLDAGKPILDLDELLRQQILTEVPIRTLCGSACRGLCPLCGADLNQGPCACPAEPEETPFSKLAALLEVRNGGETGSG